MLLSMMTVLSLITAIMFMYLSHPMAMGITILLQTTLIASMTGMMVKSFWFSYVLFLIFMGGMMVLFIYVTSLVPNEMFTLTNPSILMVILPATATIMITTDLSLTSMTNSFNEVNEANKLSETIIPIMKIYSKNICTMTLMMISYLFLTLIAVVKITNLWTGPLRSK